jgi:hypothetical protein
MELKDSATVTLNRETAIETAMSRIGLENRVEELLDMLEEIELEPEFEKAEEDISEGRLYTLEQVINNLNKKEMAWKQSC